ncbi:MAG: rhomboid family intramembrane serine protease [Solirubrobacterales bacterium]
MLPLKDNIPTDRFPVVTVALIVINVAFFVWQWAYPTDAELSQIEGYDSIQQSALEYGAIPYRITHPSETEDCSIGAVGSPTASGQLEAGVVCPGTPEYEQAVALGQQDSSVAPLPLDQAPWFVTLFTSMFMHGGILHIAGNMLFLWVFGNNIEDSMGRVKFTLFYLAAGLVAVYSQAALDISSTVPTIGASGAVAGVLGAYALLHPAARVLTLIFIIFFVTLVEIPALILLAIWFVLQFLPAIGQVATPGLGGGEGVAYFAHVGGFLFGLATIKLLARRRPDPEPPLPVY